MRDGETVLSRNFGMSWPMCNLMSATKSITSLAVGMLLDEGKIPSLDTKLQHFFPEYQGKWKDQVTIRQMLDHTSGIDKDSPGVVPQNRVASALKAPIVDEPGTYFDYNNRAVDLLAGVVRRAAGMPLDTYVNQKLFRPLGIEGWFWARDPDGNPHGSAELMMSPRDMAKIGQLMLQGGMWDGKRIISQRYIDEATTPSELTKDTGDPCGLLWWICRPNFTYDEESETRLSGRFGWPQEVLAKLKPLMGQRWPGYSQMDLDIIRAAGGWPALKASKGEMDFDWTAIPSPADDRGDSGYFANGWGGQLILVLPKLKLVAVRTGGEGFQATDDSSAYEMGDFYRLVRALYP